MPIESRSEVRDLTTPDRVFFLYHELRPQGSDYSYISDVALFEAHMDLFLRLRAVQSRSLWPEVTFDDGHRSDFEFALPILRSRGITGRFFITVGWTGNKAGYMGWPELRALHQAGQLIGAHGWSHTLLTDCAPAVLKHEVSDARLELEDKLGTAISTMSLPGGRYNQRVIAACREAGYTQIYTSQPRAERMPAGFMVGRLNVRGDATLQWFENVLQPETGALASLERQYKIKATAKKLMGNGLYEKLWSVLNRKDLKNADARNQE